ncbi:MAG TPA: DUF3293 domain-containing protein [Methylococcaceae bacterium]|nr:DUF3293 domain-containing protein [Methylococcaceae bacterium]
MEAWDDWPAEFAIVTAYATTGESWPEAENRAADRRLEAELRRQRLWMRRLTGYSPATGHGEPGWAVDLGFQSACDIGRRYRQDAIYYVIGDTLFVSFCDERRALVEVGGFRPRVHLAG